MTNRQRIDTSREARLWIGQIVVPVMTLAVTAMGIPEVRRTITSKAKDVTESIKNKFNKKKES